jgi:hypothetical protein
MFVYNASLNPQPPLLSPALFVLFKNLIPWLWLAGFVWIFRHTAFAARSHQQLFEIGLVPLAILLISPSSATYHFLLLSLSVVCFVKILLDLQRQRDAVILGALFLLINLPHYLQLIKFATGWLRRLVTCGSGCSRFFVLICRFFHRAASWRWQPKMALRYFLIATSIGWTAAALSFHHAAAKERDAAQWVPLREKEFDRHLGLLVKTPDIGDKRILFSYGELMDEDYAIFSMLGDYRIEGQWTPATPQKFYDPDLAADDQQVLMESVQNGRPEIWLSRGKMQAPEFLLEGENPSWHADGTRFAFLSHGEIGVAGINKSGAAEPAWLNTVAQNYDIAFSPRDHRLLYCRVTKEATSFLLGWINIMTGENEILLQTGAIRAPHVVKGCENDCLSWNRGGNRDLWRWR